MQHACWRVHLLALVGYGAIAVAFTWPLAAHLDTHLTGPPWEDTGLYVWNQWVFHHEVVEERSLPYLTDRIFSSTGRANLSLHNYTVFQNLVALPLVGPLGPIATFNLVYLLMVVATAYAVFLLARQVTGRAAESWIAGAAFAWSPVLVTWGTGYFSLVAAAPLAVFMLLMLRAAARERTRDAIALGATVSWAASTDAYYAVYCLVIAAAFLLAPLVHFERRPDTRSRAVPWALDVALCCTAGLIVATIIRGGWQFQLFGRVVSVRTLYTPMLVLVMLALGRAAWAHRAALVAVSPATVLRVVRISSVTGLVAAVLLSPLLYAASLRVVQGRWDAQRIYWRSGPRGVDLLAFVLPNPNHPLAPETIRTWLGAGSDTFLDNVVSLPWVAMVTILVAWRAGWRPPRLWVGFAALFGLLALGPFVHVFGVNTQVPGPWVLLRYVPPVGLARMPGRFKVLLLLAVVVLFACALVWLGDRWRSRRRYILAAVGVTLAFELLPAPRPLYSAAVPRIYEPVAEAPADVRVLQLPFGVRDGTSSAGNFTPLWQFFQTRHGKRLLGGQLSRVSRRRVNEMRADTMLGALITLSEGKPIDALWEQRCIEAAPAFVERSNVAFVVVDRARTPALLREFAMRVLRLEYVDEDGVFELYRPRTGVGADAAVPLLLSHSGFEVHSRP